MIAGSALLSAMFLLLVALFLIALGPRGDATNGPVVHRPVLTSPVWTVGRHEQNLNKCLPAATAYRLPASVTSWPQVWVGQGVPTTISPQPRAQAMSPDTTQVQQRRRLSGPAQQMFSHGSARGATR
jgi:hypothetical protein